MTDFDYWTLRLEFVGAVVQVVGLGFTIISIYITGLYFYLARAALRLRLLGFLAFTVGFCFVGALAMNLRQVSNEALYCAGCGPATGAGLDWAPDGAVAGGVFGAAIYVWLLAMTFFTGWREEAFPKTVD